MPKAQLVVPVLNLFTGSGVTLTDRCNFAVGRRELHREPRAIFIVYLHEMSVANTTVTFMSGSRRGFGLVIESIDHFNTQLVTTLNYTAIADLHFYESLK
jgi:hypothetical protein